MAIEKISRLLSTVKSEPLQKIAQRTVSKNSSKNKSMEEYTQDFIPIEDFQSGMIFLKNGSIVKILEIIPINYYEKTPRERDMIADNFGMQFKIFPNKGHIKMMNTKTDLKQFETSIREAVKDETDPSFLNRVEDYIQNSKSIMKTNSLKKRFFFIFEYEGDEKGKKSDVLDDIYFSMMQTQHEIVNAFRSMGHVVLATENDNIPIVSILYDYLNPKSKEQSPFLDRIERIRNTSAAIYSSTGIPNNPEAVDYIASRGTRMGRWNYMIMDGVFHTFFCLTDTSYPRTAYAGWLNIIEDIMPDCDIDVFYRKNMMDTTEFLLDRYSILNKGLSNTVSSSDDKKSELISASNNASYLKHLLKDCNEELYDVCTIITLRANSFKELQAKRSSFVKNMKKQSFYLEDSFMKTQEIFKMVMPLNYINEEIFKSCKRNMTNSSLSSLYFFSTFENFDDNGDILGTAVNTRTIFRMNNFNTLKYVNPHIFLCGTTGSGKTYTEMMISARMRMRKIRTMFILPLKAHEYKDDIISLGGSFISLRPGGKACINIMEIRPEGKARTSEIDDAEIAKELENGPSLVASQTINIITWIRMLMGDDRLTVSEVSELDTCIRSVYAEFGFTDDNDSIWADETKTKLKTMPIIGDLFEKVKNNPLLDRITSVLKPWVFGNCSNMNGQTNVDVDNYTLAFDVNEDYIGEDLLPAFMFLAYLVCYSIAKRDEYEMCAIILDEIWKMLAIPACAKQIFKMIKIVRGYGTCAITATQDIEDCTKNEYGRALITNSAIKIYLRVTNDEIKQLGDSIDLSEDNKILIQKLPRGFGFVCYNTERILVNFKSSSLEEEIYTTDINKKRELRQIRTRQAAKSQTR